MDALSAICDPDTGIYRNPMIIDFMDVQTSFNLLNQRLLRLQTDLQ